jgi:hypothetical protein
VNLALLDGEYKHRLRSKRAVANARISWIYLHGRELEKRKGTKWNKYWLCKHCYERGIMKPLRADSTYSCSRHLESAHNIVPPGAIAPTSQLDSYLEEVHSLAAERWRADFLNWITHDDITFSQAASERLHKVILGGGAHIRHLLPSRNTVRAWLITTYHERITDVKKSLAGARSRVNLSFDAWSSPNHVSLLGVVGHWIDEERKLKTALLALRPLDGHHGQEIADTVLPVIKLFEIEGRLGAFQMDNATNNDSALKALTSSIPSIDVRESRLRCFGHIVNLIVKAILYGDSQLQKELDDCGDREAFKVWREQGAIGKLHNIVTYIGGSDKRRKAFEQSQKVEAGDLSL